MDDEGICIDSLYFLEVQLDMDQFLADGRNRTVFLVGLALQIKGPFRSLQQGVEMPCSFLEVG